MEERKRQIFRNESWQRYLARQEATVFPHLVTPRSLAALWLTLLLFITASLLVLSKEAPVYSSGVAIAVTRSVGPNAETVLAILLSETDVPALNNGGIVKVEPVKKQSPIEVKIIEIETRPINLSEATTRFGLTTESLSKIRFPASVAFARPAVNDAALFRSEDRTSGYRVQIQCGIQRAISHLMAVRDEVKTETR